MRIVPRIASPAGFVLALLVFLLPFAAVSCEAPGLGSIDVTYTGVDLATNGDPSVETIGEFREQADPVSPDEQPPRTDVQLLAIVTLLLIAAGLVVSVLPSARVRLLGGAGAGLLAGILLVVTETVAQSNLSSALLESAERERATQPPEVPFQLTESFIDEMVQTRVGFWLALLALVLTLFVNGGFLLWQQMRARPAATGPPVPYPPPAYPPPEPPPGPVPESPPDPQGPRQQ